MRRSANEIERDVSDLVELGLLQEVRVISLSEDRDQELQKEISQRLVSAGSFEETSTSANRDLTGVAMIDSLLPEGYPSSSVVLVMGDPAKAKTTLLILLVAEDLKKGLNVV